MNRTRVLVAMSGGVDSSVAAMRLVEAGHEVVGATMKTFCYGDVEGPSRSCCGLEGVTDARAVARRLDIPHYVFDVEEEFARDVIDDFVHEYGRGRTPNPCVRCNSYTKFRDLMQRAEDLGLERIATGHYVRRTEVGGEPALLRGEYLPKDQSYFLWGVPREAIERMLFPVGDLTKDEVRSLAGDRDFVTADKPESMEICFVPDDDYARVVAERLGADHRALSRGRIVLRDGTEIGEHEGYAHFTVGQRKGLPGGQGRRLYVLEIDPDTRDVVVGEKQDLMHSRVEVEAPHWLVREIPTPGDKLQVQVRHRSNPATASVREIDGSRLVLDLDEPRRAITPGQSAALYLPTQESQEIYMRLAGGGRIKAAE